MIDNNLETRFKAARDAIVGEADVFAKMLGAEKEGKPSNWARPNSRATRGHFFQIVKSIRVFMSRSNFPYGLTCSQINGVSAA